MNYHLLPEESEDFLTSYISLYSFDLTYDLCVRLKIKKVYNQDVSFRLLKD